MPEYKHINPWEQQGLITLPWSLWCTQPCLWTGLSSAGAGSRACSSSLVKPADDFEPGEAQAAETGHALVPVEDATWFHWSRLFKHIWFCARLSVINSDFHRAASLMASENVHANTTSIKDYAVCL